MGTSVQLRNVGEGSLTLGHWIGVGPNKGKKNKTFYPANPAFVQTLNPFNNKMRFLMIRLLRWLMTAKVSGRLHRGKGQHGD